MVAGLMPLQGRDVLVLGLGASGLAMARWCAQAGARVTVADTRAHPPQAATLARDLPQVAWQQSAFDATLWARAPWALVCRSPGLAPAQWAELAALARAAGVAVVGELDLFIQALGALATAPQPYRPQVLAITGTNGKTTTTALTTHLLQAAGRHAVMAGNVGPTLLDTLSACLTQDERPEVWVLELSSFQLEGVEGFEPTAAVVLNLTQDHLDWHGSMEAYAAAKARVFGTQGLMLLNRDDDTVAAWAPPAPTKASPVGRAWQTFGANVPTRPGDWGLQEIHGMHWLVRAQTLDEPVGRRKPDPSPPEVFWQRLMPAEALRIRGRHNACNALAALALASATGAPLAPMLHGLRDYRGEPHRVEPVAVLDGVEYIDDSKGTNVGATLAALNGLGPERRLWLILGGEGKGQDFSPLVPAVARYVAGVALIGRDALRLRTTLAPTGVALHGCGDLPEAVRWCAAQARSGEVVLLSPACASLDMFRDYAHRAEVFVQTVRGLQEDAGIPV